MPSKKKTRGKARRVAKNKKAREDAAAKKDDVDSQMKRLQIGKNTNKQVGDDDEDALLEEAIKLAVVEKEELEIAAEKEELETAAKNDEVCIHGQIPFPRGHVCTSFIDKLWDVYDGFPHSDIFTRHKKVHEATKVWNDPDMMHWVVSNFLRVGTLAILDVEYNMVRHVAAFVSFLEQWVAVVIESYEIEAASNWDLFQALCDCGKICELSVADEHTLVSFFRKRIPCKCLDKRYEEVKSITKIGSLSQSQLQYSR